MSTDIAFRRWTRRREKRALQAAVALGSLVPILAGGAGMIDGLTTLADGIGMTSISLDSHFRYLSGLLFAIGLGFVSTIPGIETHGRRVQLLTMLVVIGGIGRLGGLLAVGVPPGWTLAALAMELAVTPLLALWQIRVARRFSTGLERISPGTR